MIENLKPRDRVRLRPLGECKDDVDRDLSIVGLMDDYFGSVWIVDTVDSDGSFAVDKSGYYFSPDWIAEVLPAEHYDANSATLSSVPRIKPMPYDEMQNWYNPETHKLVPVEEYVGPEEFAELKRKAAEYDRIASLRFIVSTPDAHQSADMLAQMQSGNVVAITNPTFKQAITPTPGAPDLEGVPDNYGLLLTQAAEPTELDWFFVTVKKFRRVSFRDITYHVGPIAPPEVQG